MNLMNWKERRYSLIPESIGESRYRLIILDWPTGLDRPQNLNQSKSVILAQEYRFTLFELVVGVTPAQNRVVAGFKLC